MQNSFPRPNYYLAFNSYSHPLIFSFIYFKSFAHSGIWKTGPFLPPFFFFGSKFAGSVGFLVYGSRGFLDLKSITNGSGYGSGLIGY